MTAAQLTEPISDTAEDLVPAGVVFQAGPPAYMVLAFGVVVALLACFPLMVLAAVLLISLAVTIVVAALVAAVVVAPVRLVRRLRHARPLGSMHGEQPAGVGLARPAR
jgi:hypothetical protein